MKDDLIFGYTFDEIESAQRGGRLGRAVDTSKPAGEDSEERKRAASKTSQEQPSPDSADEESLPPGEG